MADAYQGWNLIRILTEIKKWEREIAAAEKLLKTYTSPAWTSPDKATMIAEVERELLGARNTLEALKTAKETLEIANTANTTVEVVEGTTATSRVVNLLTRLGTWLGRQVGIRVAGAAATATGVVAVTTILAGVTYVGANFAGSYAGDTPVQSGPAMSRPRPAAQTPVAPAPGVAPVQHSNCCQWEVNGEPRCSNGNYEDQCTNNANYPGKFFADGSCTHVEGKPGSWSTCEGAQ